MAPILPRHTSCGEGRQPRARPVNTDPVIGEPQRGLRRYQRHVAIDAIAPVRFRMSGVMTRFADAVVINQVPLDRVVRAMAREARKRALAFAKTGALA